MDKKLLIILLVILALILLAVILVGRNGETEEIPLTFLSIWDGVSIPGREDELDFSGSSPAVRNERESFRRGMAACPSEAVIKENVLSEKDGVVGITNAMADLYNNADILLSVGASTEDITLYSTFGSGFFNIPMLVPFSDGDLDTAADTGISFRMTPTGQQYADFVGTYIAPKNLRSTFSTLLFGNDAVRDFDIKAALFFADDFNGHGTAVEIAQTLLDSGIDIEYYNAYDESGLPEFISKAWKSDADRLNDLDLVFMLGKDQDAFSGVSEAIKNWKGNRNPAFILIGYVPGGSDPDLYALDNVFMLEQILDTSNCPADVTGVGEQSAYAAGYITKLVLDRAYQKQPKENRGWKDLFRNEDQKQEAHQNYVESYRTNVRTQLMDLNDNIPCFGDLHFDLTLNSQVSLGLVRHTGPDTTERVDNNAILGRIYERIQGQFPSGE